MFKLISSLLIAATSLATPAAAGIHDFTPENSRPSNTAQARSRGNCHKTNDNSRFCYLERGNGQYILAINDVDYPEYPIALEVNCKTRKWNSYSVASRTQLNICVRAFCNNI